VCGQPWIMQGCHLHGMPHSKDDCPFFIHHLHCLEVVTVCYSCSSASIVFLCVLFLLSVGTVRLW
jgi:hypothetical protein